MEYPEELRYSKEHEWVRVEGNRAIVGITDYAQDALGDVVYVQLPDAGLEVIANASIAEIESTKSVSEVYAPVTGKVVEANATLDDAPEQLNTDPYGAGWIFVVELADPEQVNGLLDAAATARSWRSRPVERWRLVDDLGTGRDAQGQMDADLAGLDEVAAGGPPVLRLYQWTPPALSLGRFQPETDVDLDACRARGRRGGAAPDRGQGAAARRRPDLRGRAAPRPAGAAGHVDALYRTLAAGLIAGLAELGVRAEIGGDRGPAGPGVLRRGPGRGPAGGGAQALRLGPGPAGRRRAPARLGAPRPAPVRRARPPPPPISRALASLGRVEGPRRRQSEEDWRASSCGPERHARGARGHRRIRQSWPARSSGASRPPSTSRSRRGFGG